MPSREKVAEIFSNLEAGDGPGFFAHIDPNVQWTVKGSHCPISGEYKSLEEFREGTKPLTATWAKPLVLGVHNIISDGESQAAVQLKAVEWELKNGMAFPNEYVWVCHFNKDDKIVKLDAYMDTDLVTKAIESHKPS